MRIATQGPWNSEKSFLTSIIVRLTAVEGCRVLRYYSGVGHSCGHIVHCNLGNSKSIWRAARRNCLIRPVGWSLYVLLMRAVLKGRWTNYIQTSRSSRVRINWVIFRLLGLHYTRRRIDCKTMNLFSFLSAINRPVNHRSCFRTEVQTSDPLHLSRLLYIITQNSIRPIFEKHGCISRTCY